MSEPTPELEPAREVPSQATGDGHLRDAFVVAVAPEEHSLPRRCPGCQRAATRSEILQGTRLTIHYCDACADALERRRTQSLAIFAASILLALFTGAACLLALGKHFVPLQLGLILLAGTSLPGALFFFGKLPDSRGNVRLLRTPPKTVDNDAGRSGKLWLEVDESEYAHALSSTVQSLAVLSAPRARRSLWPFLIAPGLGLVFWLLVQHFADARVWVFHHEPGVVLLIDERLEGNIVPSLEESPLAGLVTNVLAGARPIALLNQRGQILWADEVRLSPGRSYLLGIPPDDYCFFWETRGYGESAGKTLRTRLSRGPWIELPGTPDRWLTPLSSEGPELTSGGHRQGLRLLRCGREHSRANSEP